jgi:hypothetical protein
MPEGVAEGRTFSNSGRWGGVKDGKTNGKNYLIGYVDSIIWMRDSPDGAKRKSNAGLW